jgi:hypothetical protein
MADPISAAIGAVATIGGGMMSSSAAGRAASTQADAAREAGALQAASARESLDFQREMYGQQRADIAPYRQAGLTAQNRLLTLLGLSPTADTMAPPTTFDEEGYNRALDNYYTMQQRAAGVEPELSGDQGLINFLTGGLGGIFGETPAPRGAALGAPLPPMPTREQFTTTTPVDQVRVDQSSPDFGRYARDFSMQDFEQDPGYAFRMSEGLKALDRQAAARGGLISGSALKGAQRFGQALGSQEYGSAFDRYQINRANQLNPLMSITGYGQTATNTLGGYGSNLASNAANTMAAGSAAQANALGAAGQARASGYVGQSNALNATLGNLGNIAGQYFAGRPSSNFLGGMSSMGTAVPTTYGPVGDLGSFGGLY